MRQTWIRQVVIVLVFGVRIRRELVVSELATGHNKNACVRLLAVEDNMHTVNDVLSISLLLF